MTDVLRVIEEFNNKHSNIGKQGLRCKHNNIVRGII